LFSSGIDGWLPFLGRTGSGKGREGGGKRRDKEFFSIIIKPSSGRAEIAQLMRRHCIPLGLWAGVMGLLMARL